MNASSTAFYLLGEGYQQISPQNSVIYPHHGAGWALFKPFMMGFWNRSHGLGPAPGIFSHPESILSTADSRIIHRFSPVIASSVAFYPHNWIPFLRVIHSFFHRKRSFYPQIHRNRLVVETNFYILRGVIHKARIVIHSFFVVIHRWNPGSGGGAEILTYVPVAGCFSGILRLSTPIKQMVFLHETDHPDSLLQRG